MPVGAVTLMIDKYQFDFRQVIFFMNVLDPLIKRRPINQNNADLLTFQRRSGMISHFMCAVAVSSAGGHPNVFHSFCKVNYKKY